MTKLYKGAQLTWSADFEKGNEYLIVEISYKGRAKTIRSDCAHLRIASGSSRINKRTKNSYTSPKIIEALFKLTEYISIEIDTMAQSGLMNIEAAKEVLANMGTMDFPHADIVTAQLYKLATKATITRQYDRTRKDIVNYAYKYNGEVPRALSKADRFKVDSILNNWIATLYPMFELTQYEGFYLSPSVEYKKDCFIKIQNLHNVSWQVNDGTHTGDVMVIDVTGLLDCENELGDWLV